MERGLKLKQLRERKNLSQTDAARFIGVSKQTLFKYENDIITNIPSDVIERLARLYDTTPSYIMGWDDAGDLYDTLLTSYMYRQRLEQYKPEDIIRALDFLDALDRLTPDRQQAIEALLKSVQPVPSLPRVPEGKA